MYRTRRPIRAGTIVDGVQSLGLTIKTSACTMANEYHTEVWCIAPPGGGVGYTWSMVVFGQASLSSVQYTSYAPPVVDSIGVDGAGTFADEPGGVPTSGGAIVTLYGANFGGSVSGAFRPSGPGDFVGTRYV